MEVYCGRCGEDAWFPASCAGSCGRTLCEDCQGEEGYCPECYRGDPPHPRPAVLTTAQFRDIESAVAYHREHGGYAEHNTGGSDCFCGGCRVVRLHEELLVAWGRLS